MRGQRVEKRNKIGVNVEIECVGDRSLKSLETSFNHILAILAYVIKLG